MSKTSEAVTFTHDVGFLVDFDYDGESRVAVSECDTCGALVRSHMVSLDRHWRLHASHD